MSDRLKQLLAMLEDDPGSAFVLFAVAKEYESTGDTEKALQTYTHLFHRHPDYTGLYYHFADLLMKSGKREEGFEVYDQGIRHCLNVGDTHALAELKNARLNWELEG